jgi:hypothetical protein
MVFAVDAKQAAFLKEFGIAAPQADGGKLAVLSRDGRVVVEAGFDELARDGKLDRARLTEFLKTRRVPLPDAEAALESALENARRDQKRVLVQVSGPNCPPCVLLARYLDEQKKLIAKDYVVLKLDARMPHANEVIGGLRPSLEGGIPWMVILAADGKPLVTSDSADGNIGYPDTKEAKSHFANMLRATALRLTEADVATLLAGLEK